MRVLRLLFFTLFFPAVSYPCTCGEPTFPEEWDRSTAVFHGKVIQVEPDREGQLRIDLKVVKSWKGPTEKIIPVFSPEHSAACGYPFEAGKEYLVYAAGKEQLHVSLCSRTRQISEAEELEKKEEKSVEKRDPFSEKTPETIKSDKLIPRALNITHAVIVGITKKGDEYVALIRATNNKVYFLKVGDKLHDGVVLKIDNNSVTFRRHRGQRVRKELRPFPDS